MGELSKVGLRQTLGFCNAIFVTPLRGARCGRMGQFIWGLLGCTFALLAFGNDLIRDRLPDTCHIKPTHLKDEITAILPPSQS